jgi:hypothetical protein
MQTVDIAPLPADRFDAFVAAEPLDRFLTVLEAGADRFADRTLGHVNSTSRGVGSPRCFSPCLDISLARASGLAGW